MNAVVEHPKVEHVTGLIHAAGGLPSADPAQMRQRALSLLPDPEVSAQVFTLAAQIAKTDFAPKNYQGKPEATAICILYGVQLGLPWNVALTSVAVVNGRPSLYGDAPLSICRQHPQWQSIAEHIEGEGDERKGCCTVQRRGEQPVVKTFSVADAKKAGLWGKQGPWTNYPDRMLQMRARGFALRDAFGDAMQGCILGEEAEDLKEVEFEPRGAQPAVPEEPRDRGGAAGSGPRRATRGRAAEAVTAPAAEVFPQDPEESKPITAAEIKALGNKAMGEGQKHMDDVRSILIELGAYIEEDGEKKARGDLLKPDRYAEAKEKFDALIARTKGAA